MLQNCVIVSVPALSIAAAVFNATCLVLDSSCGSECQLELRVQERATPITRFFAAMACQCGEGKQLRIL